MHTWMYFVRRVVDGGCREFRGHAFLTLAQNDIRRWREMELFATFVGELPRYREKAVQFPPSANENDHSEGSRNPLRVVVSASSCLIFRRGWGVGGVSSRSRLPLAATLVSVIPAAVVPAA